MQLNDSAQDVHSSRSYLDIYKTHLTQPRVLLVQPVHVLALPGVEYSPVQYTVYSTQYSPSLEVRLIREILRIM